jgi:hypothetical protein
MNFIVKPDLSRQEYPVRLGRNPFSSRNLSFSRQPQGNCSRYCPVSYHRSHGKAISVPSNVSDRIFLSRQAGDHPCSGRRDNSFMPRQPYSSLTLSCHTLNYSFIYKKSLTISWFINTRIKFSLRIIVRAVYSLLCIFGLIIPHIVVFFETITFH